MREVYSLCIQGFACPTLSDKWWNRTLDWALEHFLGPFIVAVLLTAVVGVYVQTYAAKRVELSKLIDSLRSDLQELQGLCQEYWARDYDERIDPNLESKIIILAREIEGGIVVLSENSKTFRRAVDTNDLVDAFNLDVMGESFQTKARLADHIQLRKALNATQGLRQLLRQSLLSSLSPGRLN